MSEVIVKLTMPQARALWRAAGRGIDEHTAEIEDGLDYDRGRWDGSPTRGEVNTSLRGLDQLTRAIASAGGEV